MKLPKSVLIKDTVSLFMSKYNYKIVLVSGVAYWFRHKDNAYAEKQLAKHDQLHPIVKSGILDIDFCTKLLSALKSFDTDLYTLRIESPYINFYTNQTSYIEKLAAINEKAIKFICLPNKNSPPLVKNTVIVKSLDFSFKVHVGATNQSHTSFVLWAEGQDKLRLTKRCISDLSKTNSWGGSYFYVKDDRTLTMVKMFLGANISRVEQVVKA